MAPRPPSKSSSKTKHSSKPSSSSKSFKVRKPSTSTPTKPKQKRPPATQQKTKPGVHSQISNTKPSKRKTRIYTDKELNLPSLNMITPASAAHPSRAGGAGKKKNKIFVDDQESMMTILALVNAEKEGQIESKMIRERQLEEVREARRKEAEKREEMKKEKFEGVKRDLKRKKGKENKGEEVNGVEHGKSEKKARVKKVSFA